MEWIKEQNRQVLAGLETEDHVVPGEFTVSAVVVGNYRGAPPRDVPYLMDRLVAWISQLTEGDDKITIKKWQGYPPDNLNLVGKPHPAMPDVALPRYTGKAMYATRVLKPNMLEPLRSARRRSRRSSRSSRTSRSRRCSG